jgi:hypothetical protein
MPTNVIPCIERAQVEFLTVEEGLLVSACISAKNIQDFACMFKRLAAVVPLHKIDHFYSFLARVF